MANNRPINRRPFRRPPWRKKSLRPFSWHDGYTTGAYLSNMGLPWAALNVPLANQAQHTFREILGGSVDAANLDREVVRVDRVVGDIWFWTAGADTAWTRPPVVRLGLIVEADGDTGADAPTSVNLWSSTSLAESKWQYLEQPQVRSNALYNVDGSSQGYVWNYQTHIDTRVKRSLGKTDRLWLVMTYGNGLEAGADTTNSYAGVVYYSYMMRAGIVA